MSELRAQLHKQCARTSLAGTRLHLPGRTGLPPDSAGAASAA
jgi:hypothetical protein